jgi:hypothetical protein
MGLKEIRSATHAIDVKKSDEDQHADIVLRPTAAPPTTATSCSTTAWPARRSNRA